ncbi:hypothetical protein RDWZM_004924 [Blomia tropicalis]|uniref:Putative alpha-L-fucosidase n=1 Tax=Blomia tropicalis TaxID=40697 RepID=A0A9Q0M500_BLOTA|nr:hypothetical protein RDWZM_004924 [Blomia tropicalis]
MLLLQVIHKWLAFSLFFILSINAVRYEPNWKSIDSRPLPQWYDKAKVGIFLHWGVFSVPSFGSEWFWYDWQGYHRPNFVNYMKNNFRPDFTYEEFASKFWAEFYQPDKWAELFKKSGAKYVVLTSKHHEGYTMWPSKYSFQWNVMQTGPKRDLLGELAKSVRAQNLTFGVYHSLYEWYNPLYLKDKSNGFATNEFVRFKIRPEMEELVNVYKPDVVWSDGDWEPTDVYWNSTDFLAWLYNDSPVKDTVVVNDRWGKGTGCKHGGFWNCADRYNPGKLQGHKWENAMTIDNYSWGYRREMTINDVKTIHDLIYELAKTLAYGGNILINVGPTMEGTITPIFQERLLQLGDWLHVNGEAIYESNMWKYQNDTITKDLWYTERAGFVYGIVLQYNSKIEFGSIDYSSVNSVTLLGCNDKVEFIKSPNGHVIVVFPNLTPLSHAKVAYVFKFVLNQMNF